MTDEKNWREMLAEVKVELAKDRDDVAQETRRANGWFTRLHEVFNSKAANRPLPPLTPRGRRDVRDARQQAAALRDEIMEKLRNKELTIAEVNMIAVQTRDLMPRDSKIFSMLRPLSIAAHKELEISMADDSARHSARSQEIDAMELAVFKRYLAQQPSVVPVLAAMMTEKGTIPGIATISAKAGLPLGVKELQGLSKQVNDILENYHGIPTVHVIRCPKQEFLKQSPAKFADDQCDFYFGLGGTEEVRAAVREAERKPSPVVPSLKPPGA